jgi:hypothetical protein
MNFDIFDTRSGNLVESYSTLQEATEALEYFADPDFVVLQLTSEGRREPVPLKITTLMSALEESVRAARRDRAATSVVIQHWTGARSTSSELSMAKSA